MDTILSGIFTILPSMVGVLIGCFLFVRFMMPHIDRRLLAHREEYREAWEEMMLDNQRGVSPIGFSIGGDWTGSEETAASTRGAPHISIDRQTGVLMALQMREQQVREEARRMRTPDTKVLKVDSLKNSVSMGPSKDREEMLEIE